MVSETLTDLIIKFI